MEKRIVNFTDTAEDFLGKVNAEINAYYDLLGEAEKTLNVASEKCHEAEDNNSPLEVVDEAYDALEKAYDAKSEISNRWEAAVALRNALYEVIDRANDLYSII